MPPTAHGVSYRELLPGFTAFDCARLRASLSPNACAINWSRAEPGSSCAGCPIGAAHAGKPLAPPPQLHPPCLRCGQNGRRLIGGVLCCSCFNRQREAILARNAKGSPPLSIMQRLCEAVALIKLDRADAAISALYRRRAVSSHGWTAGWKRERLPGLPRFEVLERDAAWVSTYTTGLNEMTAILTRLLPEAEILDFEAGPSLAERHAVQHQQWHAFKN